MGARVGVLERGQRCAAASRIVVFDGVYDEFRERLVAGVDALGPPGR